MEIKKFLKYISEEYNNPESEYKVNLEIFGQKYPILVYNIEEEQFARNIIKKEIELYIAKNMEKTDSSFNASSFIDSIKSKENKGLKPNYKIPVSKETINTKIETLLNKFRLSGLTYNKFLIITKKQ